MSHVPGTFRNGDGNTNIPPDTVWDEDNPPTFFICSDEIFHKRECDGNCGEFVATESQVEVVNENRRWARLGINPQVNVNGLDILCRLDILERHIADADAGIDLAEEVRWRRIEFMREMREKVEPQIKQMRAQAIAAKLPIIGPHGEILG